MSREITLLIAFVLLAACTGVKHICEKREESKMRKERADFLDLWFQYCPSCIKEQEFGSISDAQKVWQTYDIQEKELFYKKHKELYFD